MRQDLFIASGGAGRDLVVLLHGMGATGAVWHGVARHLTARGLRWLAPDMRGHGRSPSDGPFSFDHHAADVAALIADEDPARVTLLGHSFGGVVGATLVSGRHGPLPARLITLAVKTDWSAEDIALMRALAARPAKVFATFDEAQERYMKVSGLFGLVPPDAPEAAAGVRAVDGGFALAMNPRVGEVSDTDVPATFRAVRCPLRMVAGTADPMATPATMRALDPGALFLPDLPHNAHVADPKAVAALV